MSPPRRRSTAMLAELKRSCSGLSGGSDDEALFRRRGFRRATAADGDGRLFRSRPILARCWSRPAQVKPGDNDSWFDVWSTMASGPRPRRAPAPRPGTGSAPPERGCGRRSTGGRRSSSFATISTTRACRTAGGVTAPRSGRRCRSSLGYDDRRNSVRRREMTGYLHPAARAAPSRGRRSSFPPGSIRRRRRAMPGRAFDGARPRA